MALSLDAREMLQLHCFCECLDLVFVLKLPSFLFLVLPWCGEGFWLCNQVPAIDTLKEVEAFLSENPSEIVTIIIEDYVHTPKGLSTLFTNAGLLKYWFPVSQMPKNGDWPPITEMIEKNHRLLVFTSVASKEADEGIAYQWRYMVENERKLRLTLSLMYFQISQLSYENLFLLYGSW